MPTWLEPSILQYTSSDLPAAFFAALFFRCLALLASFCSSVTAFFCVAMLAAFFAALSFRRWALRESNTDFVKCNVLMGKNLLLLLPPVGGAAVGLEMHFENGGGVMPDGIIATRKMVEGLFIKGPPEKSGSEAIFALRLYLTVRGSMTHCEQRAVALERQTRTWRETPEIAWCCLSFLLGLHHLAAATRAPLRGTHGSWIPLMKCAWCTTWCLEQRSSTDLRKQWGGVRVKCC